MLGKFVIKCLWSGHLCLSKVEPKVVIMEGVLEVQLYLSRKKVISEEVADIEVIQIWNLLTQNKQFYRWDFLEVDFKTLLSELIELPGTNRMQTTNTVSLTCQSKTHTFRHLMYKVDTDRKGSLVLSIGNNNRRCRGFSQSKHTFLSCLMDWAAVFVTLMACLMLMCHGSVTVCSELFSKNTTVYAESAVNQRRCWQSSMTIICHIQEYPAKSFNIC